MLALDWVKNDILSKRITLGGVDKYPAIVNISLEINSPPTTQTTITSMIQTLVASNITVVVAAGNGIVVGTVRTGQNVANVTPAGIKEVITVGATNSNDSFALNFSNFGTGVDILAPGTFVIYPYHQADTYIGGTVQGPFDGTSFSAPLVAGAAALYLQSNPSASPQSVRDALVRNATRNKITNIPIEVTPSGSSATTPNRLLFTRFRALAVRNGASYGNQVAPDSLATIFGTELNPDNFLTLFWGPEDFQSFLSLTNSSILYWGDTQINFLISSAIPDGDLMVGTGTEFLNPSSHGTVPLSRIAPGMFSANSSGQGLAAGQLVRVNISNPSIQTSEQLSSTGNVLNPSTEYAYLQLYGTGIRYRNSLGDVSAKVGGINVPVAYAGNQNEFIGLDQVNLGPLPSSVKGVGLVDIEITVEDKRANKIQVNLQ